MLEETPRNYHLVGDWLAADVRAALEAVDLSAVIQSRADAASDRTTTVALNCIPHEPGVAPLLAIAFGDGAPDPGDLLTAVTTIPRAKTITWNVSAPTQARARDIAEAAFAFAQEGATDAIPLPLAVLPSGERKERSLSDGATLSYVEYGAGPRVIITAQAGFPAEPTYASLLAETIPGTRVLEVTLRGYRPSSLAPEDLGLGWLDQWADDIAELATLLGIETFLYTGGSHGGGVGWYLAARYPHRLGAYIGVVSGPHDREGDTSSSPVRRSINDAWPDVEAVGRLMEESVFGPLSHEYRAARRRALIEAATAEYGEMLPEEARINQGKPWPNATTDELLAVELEKIAVPTLLLSGAQDVIISARASLRAAMSVPDATMVLWQDEGHMTWEEEPRRLVAEVKRYIEARGL